MEKAAIEHAIVAVKEKEKEKIKKQLKKGETNACLEYCLALDNALEEGRKSPIFLSPGTNRRASRREAVSEKNELERDLVKGAVRKLAQDEQIAKYKII